MDQFKWKAINLNFISFCGSGAKHYLIRYWLVKAQIEHGVTGQGERSSFFAVCHCGFSICRQPEHPRGSGGCCSGVVWKGKIDCCLINKENKLLRDGSNFLNKSEARKCSDFIIVHALLWKTTQRVFQREPLHSLPMHGHLSPTRVFQSGVNIQIQVSYCHRSSTSLIYGDNVLAALYILNFDFFI